MALRPLKYCIGRKLTPGLKNFEHGNACFVHLVTEKAAYKGMVRPILEYGSLVWDPHPDKLQEELEKIQNRAARFETRNYVYETGSMTGIL